MSKVKTYDPKKVTVIFGTCILEGFAEGTFVNVETQGDGITAVVGCDQEIVRNISPDSILKNITITLLQTSVSNDELSLMHDLDIATGQGLYPMAIKDLSGRSVMVADQAWIVKKPVFKRGKIATDGNVEWNICAVGADEAFLIGGSDI